MIFQGIRTSIVKESYCVVIFQGDPDLCPLIWIRAAHGAGVQQNYRLACAPIEDSDQTYRISLHFSPQLILQRGPVLYSKGNLKLKIPGGPFFRDGSYCLFLWKPKPLVIFQWGPDSGPLPLDQRIRYRECADWFESSLNAYAKLYLMQWRIQDFWKGGSYTGHYQKMEESVSLPIYHILDLLSVANGT